MNAQSYLLENLRIYIDVSSIANEQINDDLWFKFQKCNLYQIL